MRPAVRRLRIPAELDRLAEMRALVRDAARRQGAAPTVSAFGAEAEPADDVTIVAVARHRRPRARRVSTVARAEA